MSIHDAIASLQSEMANRGYYPREIIADGRLRRFSCTVKKGKKNQWYVVNFTENILHGAYGDWRTGEKIYYSSIRESEMDWLQKAKLEAERERQKRLYEEEQKRRAEDARKTASFFASKIDSSLPHTYITKKQIGIAEGAGIYRDVLFIPAVLDGVGVGMQKIFTTGEKRWIVGTPQHGIYFTIGDFSDAQTLYIAEGYATAYSVRMATGKPTVVAFTKNNLLNVGEYFREKYPHAEIVFCADNDEDSGGEKLANRAAEIVNGKVALCPVKSDFNDMHVSQGIDAVRSFLCGGQVVTKETDPVVNVAPVIIDNTAKEKKSDHALPQHLLDAPNLVGMLADFIDSTAVYRQPVLSLAAALPAIGCLMGHKLKVPKFDTRSNIYSIGVAPTTTGKGNAKKVITRAFIAGGFDTRKIINNFASDAAIESALKENYGVAFAVMDEIGDELKAISNKNSQGYEARVIRSLKEIYSASDDEYIGKQLANRDGKSPPVRISQPCLCLYGMTTPKKYYETMTESLVEDGFMGRFLIFEGDPDPEIIESPIASKDNPPDNLVNWIDELVHFRNEQTISTIIRAVNPKEVTITEGAWDKFNGLFSWERGMHRLEAVKGSGLEGIYGRCRENALKMALVACDRNHIIDAMTAAWACELSQWLCERYIVLIRENMVASDYEKQFNAVYQYILSAGLQGRTKKQIANRFRMPIRQRDDILRDLCMDSKMVDVIEDSCNNNKIKQTFVAI